MPTQQMSITVSWNYAIMYHYTMAILNKRSFSSWISGVLESHVEAEETGEEPKEVATEIDLGDYLRKPGFENFDNFLNDLEMRVGRGDRRLENIMDLGETVYINLRSFSGLVSLRS